MKSPNVEKVLVVVDGDNFEYYFGHISEPIHEVVQHFVADRLFGVKPKYFASFEANPESEEQAKYSERLLSRIRSSDYFDLELTQMKKYLEPFFVFSRDLPITDVAPAKKRGYGDSEVCVHVYANLKKFDTLMLFANDKHFARMNDHLRRLGKRVEVYSPVITVNRKLRSSCDSLTVVVQFFPVTYPLVGK